MASRLLSLVTFASAVLSAALPAQLNTRQTSGVKIFPNINVTDTDGNFIQAHGGTIVQDSGSFYWFGENKSGSTSSNAFKGVSCYKSSDLGTWESRGNVLTPQADTNISESRVVERPKVLYNEKNDEFVMWFHGDSSNYGDAQVGVATSKTIDGEYTWKGNFKPFGTDSRDMTVWKDPDNGDAYLIFASDGNANLKIASLDDDYYTVVEQLYIWNDVYWEAPGVLKVDGVFYLLYSRQDGWTPTDNYYMSASSMSGPWSSATLLHPEGLYAYNSQNTYEIAIQGTDGLTYLYLGDHWNAPDLGASTYAWYPLEFNNGGLSLTYSDGYSVDVAKGTWSELSSTTKATGDLTPSNASAVEDCSSCSSQKTINMNNASFSFVWDGSSGDKVLQIKYTYAAGKQEWKTLGVTVDGTEQGAALLESSRNAANYFDAPITIKSVKSGSNITVSLQNASGSTSVYVTSVDVFDA